MILKKTGKIVLIVVVTIVLILGILTGYFFLFMDPSRQTVKNAPQTKSLDTVLTKNEAIEDLDYLYDKIITRHPLWLDKDDSVVQSVAEKYQEIKDNFGDNVSVLELYQDCSFLLSMIHDGHTYVFNNNDYKVIDDFSQIREYGAPVKINGVPYSQVLDQFKKHSSYEYDFYIEDKVSDSLILADANLLLAGVDISDGVTFTYLIDGKEKDYHYNFVEQTSDGSDEGYEWVYYDIYKEDNVGVFTLLKCTNNDEYKQKVKDFFNEVNDNNISNIIVDLRYNGGGNSSVLNEFLSYCNVDRCNEWNSDVRLGWMVIKNRNIEIANKKQDPNFDGKLYVLTNVRTYSSAMDFAMVIKDNHLGTLIGEPSGNSPDGYGDCLLFSLPNSNLGLSVSKKKWYRIDQTKNGEPIMPDIEVDSEKALDKALEVIKNDK